MLLDTTVSKSPANSVVITHMSTARGGSGLHYVHIWVKGKPVCHLLAKWLWSQGGGCLRVGLSLETLNFFPIKESVSETISPFQSQQVIWNIRSQAASVHRDFGRTSLWVRGRGEKGDLQRDGEEEKKSEGKKMKNKTKKRRRDIWKRMTIFIPWHKIQAESVGSRKTWAQRLAPPLSAGGGKGTLGQSVNSLKLQFLHLKNRDENSISYLGIILSKCLVPCLAQSKFSIQSN